MNDEDERAALLAMLPVKVPTLGAPRPGDDSPVDPEHAYWQRVRLGIDDPLDPRSFLRHREPEDRVRFQEAYERRVDEIGAVAAASEIASKAMRELRSIRLVADLSAPRGPNRTAARWHESRRTEEAHRQIDALRGERREIAFRTLAKLGVPDEEQVSILRGWRALRGVPDELLLDDVEAFRGDWPSSDELIGIVAHRRRATEQPTKPTKRVTRRKKPS